MRDGDVFTAGIEGRISYCDLGSEGPWVFCGNLFLSANRGAAGTVVGITQEADVLTASGDRYYLSVDTGGHSITTFFKDNVFDQTGMKTAGEAFATFGGGSYVYAVTTYGNVFRWKSCEGGPWEYVGAYKSGPTNATRPSWGSIKSRYR